MTTNRLNLNSSKTQLVWFGSKQQLLKLDDKLIASTFRNVTFSSSVCDLGVTLDRALTFADLWLVPACMYYQLRHLRAIRRTVPAKVFSTMIHAFVCTRINYCNLLIIGLSKVQLASPQSVLNAAARLIARLPPYLHISACIINELHWLPILACIRYKVLLLVAKSQQGLVPKYLCELMCKPLSAHSFQPFHSADWLDVLVPWSHTSLSQCNDILKLTNLLYNC